MFDPISLGFFFGAAKLGAAAIERYERSKADKRRAERRRVEAANPITAPAVEDNREKEEQRLLLVQEEREKIRPEQADHERDTLVTEHRERVEREGNEQVAREHLERAEQLARMHRERADRHEREHRERHMHRSHDIFWQAIHGEARREKHEQLAKGYRERAEQYERKLNSMRNAYNREFRERHEQIQVQAPSDEAARALAEKWAWCQSQLQTWLQYQPQVPPNFGDIYKSLPILPGRLRVLEIEPGEGKLITYLRVVPFDTCYEAVSYCWEEDSRSDFEMYVNDVRIEVSNHLGTYLTRSRLEASTRISSVFVWIDQLCINQNDMAEKKVMVHAMDQVYGNANKVVVWLGQELGDSNAVIKWFADSGESASDQELMIMYTKSPGKWTLFFDAILSRRWWQRTWTIQEVMLGGDRVDILHGSSTIRFSHFVHITDFTNRHGLRIASTQLDDRRYNPVLTMANFKRRLDDGDTIPLVQWIEAFICQKITYHEDRFVAFLGLDKNPIYQSLKVDNISVEEAYIDATKRIIEAERKVNFIFLGRGLHRLPNLPSWVPDLTCDEREALSAKKFYHCMPRHPFNATGGRMFHGSFEASSNQPSPHQRLWMTGTILAEKIVDIGRVNKVRAAQMAEESQETIDEEFAGLGEDLFRMSQSQPIDYWLDDTDLRESVANMVGKTVMCDMFPESKRLELHQGLHTFNPEIKLPADWLPQLGQEERQRLLDATCHNITTTWWHGRRLALSGRGKFCMVPHDTDIGDTIALLDGTDMPCILRKNKTKPNVFRLIGPCYVHGIMDGEAMPANSSPEDRGPDYICLE